MACLQKFPLGRACPTRRQELREVLRPWGWGRPVCESRKEGWGAEMEGKGARAFRGQARAQGRVGLVRGLQGDTRGAAARRRAYWAGVSTERKAGIQRLLGSQLVQGAPPPAPPLWFPLLEPSITGR